MRRPLIVANWKMNTTLSDALVLTQSIKNKADVMDEVEIVLCPPFVWLVPMAEILERAPDNLKLGAQNMWFAEKGPMTGEISPLMLKNLVDYVILGHSERRLHFNESNALINDKVQAALNFNLMPLVCVGELKKASEHRGRGRRPDIEVKSDIIHQLKSAMEGVSKEKFAKVVVCYEPLWAISKGTESTRNPATGTYAASVIAKLRDAIAAKYGQDLAENTRILYGGSVDASNVWEFVLQPEIDGVLVGGASLKAKEFLAICQEAAGSAVQN